MATPKDVNVTETNGEIPQPDNTSLVSAIKTKYCSPPKDYYDPDVLHSQREIKMIAGSRRPGHYTYHKTLCVMCACTILRMYVHAHYCDRMMYMYMNVHNSIIL